MSNKRFSDVAPNRDDKDGNTPAKTASGKTLPTSNPSQSSFKAPGGDPRIRLKEKGGKDLPVPTFVEHKNKSDEATGELPPGI